uniref:TRIM8/14/16/25/29/45/65 coiled-coil region domain-containing protein n=1 Tax=Electrophorus electricus TaxID=8005 RepID=A0A4W4FZZ7_ELEEL
ALSVQLDRKIQEQEKKVQELKQAVDTLKRSAQAAVEDSERIFTELICSIEKKRCEVRELIRDQEKAQLSQAEGLLDQLEQEIADLKRRDSELQQLSHTEDHVQFLQSFQSLCVSSGSEDSTSIPVHQHLSFDGVKKSLSDLKERLEEFCKEEFNKIPPQGKSRPAVKHNDGNLYLLSDRGALILLSIDEHIKHLVTWSERVQPYSDHPERSDYLSQVMCKESVCGHCYWDVEWSSVGGVIISVSYKDISRKGRVWFICHIYSHTQYNSQ